MELHENSENQENQPHYSGKKHVEESTHVMKSGLVNAITGLTPRASHGGLLSPRHPNINMSAANNQMKESVAEVDVRGVEHARRHTRPVEHEPALNITMSPVPVVDTQIANLDHLPSSSSSSSSSAPPSSLQAIHHSTSIANKENDLKNTNENQLTESQPVTQLTVGGGKGRRRCYSNHHADTLNLFATNAEESVVASNIQTTQCTSVHEHSSINNFSTTNLERHDTKISKSRIDDDSTNTTTHGGEVSLPIKWHEGKMQSDKYHNVTQTSEERAMTFLQDLCNSATSSETTHRPSIHHKNSDDIVHYAQQLLRQASDTRASNSIDLVKEVEKLQRRITSDAFAASSDYRPKSASVQHNTVAGKAAAAASANTVDGSTTEQETARTNSTSRTNSPSPVPVYVRIAKNAQGNYTHYDELGNVVITSNNAEAYNTHTVTKQLEFTARTPPPPPSSSCQSAQLPFPANQQTKQVQEQTEREQQVPVVINANASSVKCDTIFNAEYPPPPAVGVRSPFFQRKMLVKPILQPYAHAENTELESNTSNNNDDDHNHVKETARQASLSRKAQNNVECTEDYDTLALKRARARAASRSQEQKNAKDKAENDDHESNSNKRSKVEISNADATQSTTLDAEGRFVSEHASNNNDAKDITTHDENGHQCESEQPLSQRGLLQREMEMKWKAREEAALQRKTGRGLVGQNYKKTSLW